MQSALVIGNGESRRGLDLDSLSRDSITFGCNAIHRDFIPDYLVCCDRRMVRESLENNKLKILLTRKDWISHFKNFKIESVPDLPWVEDLRYMQPIHWGSGPYAVLTAAILGFKKIKLVGFDLYGHGQCINNIYKDTKHYLDSQKAAVDHSYWLLQISKIFEYFSHSEFLVLNYQSWSMPVEWQKNNVKKVAL